MSATEAALRCAGRSTAYFFATGHGRQSGRIHAAGTSRCQLNATYIPPPTAPRPAVRIEGASTLTLRPQRLGGPLTLRSHGSSTLTLRTGLGRPARLRAAGTSSVRLWPSYIPPALITLPPASFLALTQFQGGAVRQLPESAVTADEPVTLALQASGTLELSPPQLSLTPIQAMQRRVLPGITVDMPTPAIINGRPMLPAYWARTGSSVAAVQGPGHIRAIADPDPVWDPARDGWYNPDGSDSPPPASGVGVARWSAHSLPDPAGFRRGMYWLGEPSAADYTIGNPPATRQWAPDAATPGAPSWRSVFPYKPSVWNHVHYGEGGRVLTISRGVRFNLQFVEHMWLDWGADRPQPFTWVIVGIVMDFPSASYTHHLLDMGRDPRQVGFPPISDSQAERNDYLINDGAGYRNMLSVNRSQLMMGTQDNPPPGHIVRSRFVPAPRPRMFFGVFNGAHSTVGNYSRDGKFQTKGTVANTAAQRNRHYVLGRAKGHISQDFASHLVVFEIRYFNQALPQQSLDEQYGQLASTWKFGEYR